MKINIKINIKDRYEFKVFNKLVEIYPKEKVIYILKYHKKTWLRQYRIKNFKFNKYW